MNNKTDYRDITGARGTELSPPPPTHTHAHTHTHTHTHFVITVCKLMLIYDYINMDTNKLDKENRDEIIKTFYGK